MCARSHIERFMLDDARDPSCTALARWRRAPPMTDFRSMLAAAWEQVSAGGAWAASLLPPGASPAAWLQALGSVLAILCAAWIMRRQNRAALELTRQAEIAREEAEEARS